MPLWRTPWRRHGCAMVLQPCTAIDLEFNCMLQKEHVCTLGEHQDVPNLHACMDAGSWPPAALAWQLQRKAGITVCVPRQAQGGHCLATVFLYSCMPSACRLYVSFFFLNPPSC